MALSNVDLLRGRRGDLHMSQQELATKIGRSLATVNTWLNDPEKIPLKYVVKIKEALLIDDDDVVRYFFTR